MWRNHTLGGLPRTLMSRMRHTRENRIFSFFFSSHLVCSRCFLLLLPPYTYLRPRVTSHLFSLLPITGRAFIFIASIIQHFLPSSTRVLGSGCLENIASIPRFEPLTPALVVFGVNHQTTGATDFKCMCSISLFQYFSISGVHSLNIQVCTIPPRVFVAQFMINKRVMTRPARINAYVLDGNTVV